MSRVEVINFNSGELSPQIDSRSETKKYSGGCRILENMIPRIYGPATRRPGTEYINTTKYSPQGIRLMPFIYSASIAYMIEAGDLYFRFYYNGAVVKTGTNKHDVPIETVTPYLVADLNRLHFAHVGDVMRIVHGSYRPRKLIRATALQFDLDVIEFNKGPFRKRNDLANEDGITLTYTGTVTKGSSGVLDAVGGTVFDDPLHVDSIWKLTHARDEIKLSLEGVGTQDTFDDSGEYLFDVGTFNFVTHGTWAGTIKIMRKEGDNAWEDFRVYTADMDRNIQFAYTEKDPDAQYKLASITVTEDPDGDGTFTAEMVTDNTTHDSMFRVTAVASATQATVTVLQQAEAVEGITATLRWAEGSWSFYRGFPVSVEFYEGRCIYLGTEDGLATVWCSTTDDFDNFLEGVDDNDSFAVVVPSTNEPRWLRSLESLIVGTEGDEWRLGTSQLDSPVTPTTYIIKQQANTGGGTFQPLVVNSQVVFFDSVHRKMREISFTAQNQKYMTPDLTMLADHISGDGFLTMAYQKNPDPILWTNRQDGTLCSMTYEREQSVIAWSRHPMSETAYEATDAEQPFYSPPMYPTLQELTPAEIPDAPAAPVIPSVTVGVSTAPFDNGDSSNPIEVGDTLTSPGNNFSSDANCKALWNFDSWSEISTDTIGTNTLTPESLVEGTSDDTTDFKQGTASLDLTPSSSDYQYIANADLDSGFPLKGGESNLDISVSAWVKYDSLSDFDAYYGKYHTTNARSLALTISNGSGQYRFHALIGYDSGTKANGVEDDKVIVATGIWYHVVFTYTNSTRTATYRIYDSNADTAYSTTIADAIPVAESISATTTRLEIGRRGNQSQSWHDGHIDEVAVFSDVLSDADADEIRNNTYGPDKTGNADAITYSTPSAGSFVSTPAAGSPPFYDNDIVTGGGNTIVQNGTAVVGIGITDPDGLRDMSGSGTYVLLNDIDMTGESLTPISNFSGTLDGGNYRIHDWTHSSPSSDEQALFASVKDGFKCKNLTFEDCSVTGDDEVGILFGDVSLADTNTILVSNVNFVSCTVVGNLYCGILAGRAQYQGGSKYYNCTATDCAVSGDQFVGGLFGKLIARDDTTLNTWLSSCAAINTTITNASTSVWKMGGFAGEIYGRSSTAAEPIIYLYDCYTTGTITITDQDALAIGGFVGFCDLNIYYVTCYSTLDIIISSTDAADDAENIGGFIGDESTYSSYINCNCTGDVTIDIVRNAISVGGFIGYFDATDITHVLRCYTSTDINITTAAGSVVGVGGFIGEFNFTNNPAAMTRVRDDVIERSWADGDITVSSVVAGTASCGGFIGYVNAPSDASARSYGFKDCYSWSQINIPAGSTDAFVGGFAGYCDMVLGQTILFDNCYDAQTDSKFGSGFSDELVYASSETGGLIGEIVLNDGTIIVTDSFWDEETTGLDTSADVGSLPKSTDWMMTRSNYEAAGWDFDTIWVIDQFDNLVPFEAEGEVGSVAVIPGINAFEGEDEVWIDVLRNIGGTEYRFIERMRPRKTDTQDDWYFVDCGVAHNGDSITEIGGLDHIEGQTVKILGDGAVFAEQVVTGGQVTVPEAVSKAAIGLAYTYNLQPMRLDKNTAGGASHGMVKKISRIFLNWYKTLGAKYGISGNLYDIDWRTEEDYGDQPAPFSGDKDLVFDGGLDSEDKILITGDEPQHCTVRAIIVETDRTD